MPWVIPFIPLIAAGIGGGVAVGTSIYQGNQADNSADRQLEATNLAQAKEASNFDKGIAAAQDEQDYTRWLTSATATARQPYLDALAASLGSGFGSYAPQTYTPGVYEPSKPFVAPDPKELEQDKGYQFEKAQGLDAVSRANAANGTRLTGGFDKDTISFAEGLASTRNNERRDRALQEYSLGETLRQAAYDRNETAKLNAVNVNNQGAYSAASLANQGLGSRLSALSSLASLALPVGTYPGSTIPGGKPGTGGTLPGTGDFKVGGDGVYPYKALPNKPATDLLPDTPYEQTLGGVLKRKAF